MLGALIIVFREVIEAGLIIGIVMAATRGVAGRGRWVTIGVVAGIVGATLVVTGVAALFGLAYRFRAIVSIFFAAIVLATARASMLMLLPAPTSAASSPPPERPISSKHTPRLCVPGKQRPDTAACTPGFPPAGSAD